METRAVYAGSFDLLTVGHMWMIEQGVELFDHLVIAIGVNPAKTSMFSVDSRMDMIRQSIYLAGIPKEKTSIISFPGFLYRAAEEEKATHILRGVRNSEDFEYERVMRNLNADFCPSITTVFLTPPRELSEISSSIVKGLMGPTDWPSLVKPMVPSYVFAKLLHYSDHGDG